jgi:hypothetical protein
MQKIQRLGISETAQAKKKQRHAAGCEAVRLNLRIVS